MPYLMNNNNICHYVVCRCHYIAVWWVMDKRYHLCQYKMYANRTQQVRPSVRPTIHLSSLVILSLSALTLTPSSFIIVVAIMESQKLNHTSELVMQMRPTTMWRGIRRCYRAEKNGRGRRGDINDLVMAGWLNINRDARYKHCIYILYMCMIHIYKNWTEQGCPFIAVVLEDGKYLHACTINIYNNLQLLFIFW